MLCKTEGKRKCVWAPEDTVGWKCQFSTAQLTFSLHEKIKQGISPENFKPVFFRSLSHSWMKTLTWLTLVTEPDLDSTPLNSQLRVFSTTCATYKSSPSSCYISSTEQIQLSYLSRKQKSLLLHAQVQLSWGWKVSLVAIDSINSYETLWITFKTVHMTTLLSFPFN